MTDQHPHTRSQMPKYFWIAFVVLLLVHTVRAVGQMSPIYGGDEYAYLISGLYRADLAALWTKDPMLQKIANPMYLWMIAQADKLFVDVSAVMRVLNAFIFCATIAWCARWVHQRSGPGAALGVLCLGGLLPSSALTAAVMADITYYSFGILAALMCCGAIVQRPRQAAIAAGVMVALAFLTKPHALAFIGAMLVFLTLSPFVAYPSSDVRPTLRTGLLQGGYLSVWFLVAMYLTLLIASLIYYGRPMWNPRYPLGVFYANIADSMATSGVAEALERPVELMRYFFANMGSALSITWPFWVILALGALREQRSVQGGNHTSLWSPSALLMWLLIALPMATGMVAFFTFSISLSLELEGGRVHTRYYAFLYVVAIVGGLAVRDWGALLRTTLWSRGRVRVDGYVFLALTWAVVCALTAWLLTDMRVWFQDNVELFHLFSANWRASRPTPYLLMTAAIGMGFALFLFKARYIKGLFAGAMTVFFASALWEVTCIQHIHSSVIHFRIESGQLLSSYLPDVRDDQILVVGDARYGQTSHVLYGLHRSVYVRQTPPGTAVELSAIPAGVRYVFAVDHVPVAMPTTILFSSKAGTLHALQSDGE